MAGSLLNSETPTSSGQRPQPGIFDTSAFQLVIANAQIRACDEALALCAGRDRLREEALELQRTLKAVESECQHELLARTKAAGGEVTAARKAADAAVAALEACRQRLKESDRRLHAVLSASLAPGDAARIAAAAATAMQAYEPEIRQLQAEQDAAKKRFDEHTKEIAELTQTMAAAQAAIAILGAGTLPEGLKPIIDRAAQRAEATHATQAAAAQTERRRVAGSIADAQRELTLQSKIHAKAAADAAELKKVARAGVFAHLTSSVWWGSFGTDYQQEASAAAKRMRATEQRMQGLSQELQKADEAISALAAGRATFIADAIAVETDSQRRRLCDTIAQSPREVERLQTLLAADSAAVARAAELMNAAISKQRLAGESAEKTERAAIRLEAEQARAASQAALEDAQSKEAALARILRDAEESLARLPKGQEATLLSRQAPHKTRVAEIDAELDQIQTNLARLVTQNGLGVSHPFASSAIASAREARLKAIGPSSPKGDTSGSAGVQTARGRPRMTVSETNGMGTPAFPPAVGHLYLDFERNAEDNADRQGRTFPGLRRQLSELCRRHGGAILNGVNEADVLAVFQDNFFPHGLTQTYLVSNLSLREGQAYLALRPKVIGPRLEQLLPRGMTIAVCGRLWDPENPVFLVQRLVDLSHSDARPFERELTAFVFTQPEPVYRRQNNVLPPTFVSELPPISALTRGRLQDWQAYLDWKERLIQANLVGLRYLKVEVTAEGRYRFLVAAESKESFERVQRNFRNDDFRAFGLNYSLEPWEFDYNEDHRGRDVELGDFERCLPLDTMPEADTEGMPWADPFIAYVYFRMDEEDQNEFDAMVEAGNHDDAATHFRSQFQSAGFLALSVVGDLSLVRRQRKELESLQYQSG